MTSIGERQSLDRVLAKSPIVQAVLEQQKREDVEARRAAIERRKIAEARFAEAEASREERIAKLEEELAPIKRRYEAQLQRVETAKQLIEQEVGIARGELHAADRAIRELAPLQRFEAWRAKMSRAMQLAKPRIDPRPKREEFRRDAAFEEALEAWNAKANALSEQIHELARMARSVMNMAPLTYATDEEAIEACELALKPLKALVSFPSVSSAA